MLEKIRGVAIKGKCYQPVQVNLTFFPKATDRISIAYGRNGSGKSTVASALSHIADFSMLSDGIDAHFYDESESAVELSEDSKIFVFNEQYIDSNIRIEGDGLGSIVLFGGDVGKQAEIDECMRKIADAEGKCDAAQKECDKYNFVSSPLSPEFHWAKIEAILKQSGGWAENDSKIKGNRRNSSVTVDIITEICKLIVKEPPQALQQQFNDTQELLGKISDSSISFPDIVCPIEFSSEIEDTLIKILAIEVKEPVLSEREKLILQAIQDGHQDYVESGRSFFGRDDTKTCPYCYQPVSSKYKHELIESINRVLNKDVDRHQAELESFTFPTIPTLKSEYEQLDKELFQKLNAQAKKCQECITQYEASISAKKGNIYTPIIIQANGLAIELHKLNELLATLEVKRQEFNNAAKKKKDLKEQLLNINKQLAHFQVAQTYKDYCKQCDEKIAKQAALEEIYKSLTTLKKSLKRLQEKKSNTGLAIESINAALDYVFFSDKRLSIELHDNKYYLKSKGVDVRPKDISLGERNIIGLCYFFTDIMSNQDIHDLYKQECLIVVDDPVSSFDFENKIGITSFLRYQISRIIFGNANSKILILSHDLETVTGLRKSAEEICQATKGIAGVVQTTYIVQELDIYSLHLLTKSHNEYGVLLNSVYQFANGEISDDSATIGNAMRRVLEAFSTFNYQKSIEKVSCDKEVLKLLGDRSLFFENLMYRLVLHGESHFEEQIYSIHDGYYFFGFISEDEKRKIAKYILCFIYLLNPMHLTTYLKAQSDVATNLNNWVRTIPANSSFSLESEKPHPKRMIELYAFPLSAGGGNDISDDTIPHENYLTDNPTCDFALRVSGDSMEPEIPDGSIVLIRATEFLSRGSIGAFYYEGEVYCKQFDSIDGKTVLVSLNPEYDNIEIRDQSSFKIYGEVIEVCHPDD